MEKKKQLPLCNIQHSLFKCGEEVQTKTAVPDPGCPLHEHDDGVDHSPVTQVATSDTGKVIGCSWWCTPCTSE